MPSACVLHNLKNEPLGTKETMKPIKAILLALAISTGAIVSAQAQNYGYTTPRFGGGYNYYGSQGYSGYSTPRFGGGYNYYDNQGNSGYTTPRFGGGYNYYNNNGFGH